MSLRVSFSGKRNLNARLRLVKASHNMAPLVAKTKPEAVVIYPWPGWSVGNTMWKTELVNLEKFSDELWVGVKG